MLASDKTIKAVGVIPARSCSAGALGGPIACTDEGLASRGRTMKGAFTLAIYVAIGITGAAFGQAENETIVVRTPLPQYPPDRSNARTDRGLVAGAGEQAPAEGQLSRGTHHAPLPALNSPARGALAMP